MNALIRWRLEPCRGIIVFCIPIFPHYQWLWTKSASQTTNGFKVCVCECSCVPSLQKPIDWQVTWGHTKIITGLVIVHATGTPLFGPCCELPCLLLWVKKQCDCQEMRRPAATCTLQYTAHFKVWKKEKWWEKKFSGILLLFGFSVWFIACDEISAARLFSRTMNF